MSISKADLQLIADTIRTLSMDAVQKANSGHPGLPMGCAEIGAVLWSQILIHNPADPKWPNRDRFVLSAGHGSMWLYSLMHLSGYGLTIDDLKNFRQLHSLTPGHPENTVTPGVETTTGPLGQGFANGVGMAVAEKLLQEEFPGLIDHHVIALVSDGDLMEGISSEAASIAGHMQLDNLIYIYDSNDISIEGSTDLTFSEDIDMRFKAYGWHVQTVDGHDCGQISAAVDNAKADKSRPSIIIAKTRIAKGSPNKEGSADSHGSPLGEDEVRAAKRNIGWDENLQFHVPERVYEIFKERNSELKRNYDEWMKKFEAMPSADRDRWNRFFAKPDIAALRKKIPPFDAAKNIATRSASGTVLSTLFSEVPSLAGGSADLAPSNKSFVKGFSASGRGSVGRNIHFGIRENAMGSIQNGMAYYGGFIPYSATFFAFMDYMRPAIRIASIAKLQTIYIFTHDSLFVGEDGPTHQPVEHLAAARAIPGLWVIRPADAEETREAWLAALGRTDGPTLLSLTRNDIPIIKRENSLGAENLMKGAYPVRTGGEKPDVVILASGSEVQISVEAADDLLKEGINARVVSFPCWELFDMQPKEYRRGLLCHGTPKVVVEAGLRMGWERYSGNHAEFVTMEQFGLSAPWKTLAKEFGFTKENVIAKVKSRLKK
jgi:transketolase